MEKDARISLASLRVMADGGERAVDAIFRRIF